MHTQEDNTEVYQKRKQANTRRYQQKIDLWGRVYDQVVKIGFSLETTLVRIVEQRRSPSRREDEFPN